MDKNDAPFGISEESVSSVVRAKNRLIAAIALIIIGVVAYFLLR